MLLQCTDYFVIFIVLKSPEFRKQSLWNSNFSGGGPPDPPLWFWNPPYFWGLKVGKYTKQTHLKGFPQTEPSTKRGTQQKNGRWWGRSGPKCQGRFFVPVQPCIQCITIIKSPAHKSLNCLPKMVAIEEGLYFSQKTKLEKSHLNNRVNLFIRFQTAVKGHPPDVLQLVWNKKPEYQSLRLQH